MKNLCYILLIALTGLAANSCIFQPKQSAQTFAETEVKGDTTFHFHSLQKKLKPNNDTLVFYWTKSGKIFTTRGGSFGRLLHGEYTVFVANKMVFSGAFNNGLKSGVWKKWEMGRLVSVYNWKNGQLHGKYAIYNEDGTLQESGLFSKGKKK
jgi:antitoxin component YwqK of YwqJK toxin-antitoxin module